MAQLIHPDSSGATIVEIFAPSLADDPGEVAAWSRRLRAAASPSAIEALWLMALQADVRHILPTISCPTLVLHRRGDRAISVHAARWMAEQIPGARFVELPGHDHFPWVGDQDAILGEIEELVTGTRVVTTPDRRLLTVLFTDIVDSTATASRLGDDAWRRLLEQHHAAVRRYLEQFEGREVDTAGDGFLATFDGPARAVRCALGIASALAEMGLRVRAGVHTGEVEVHGTQVTGLAVHIGARIAALADAGEVLVSRTVKDLVVGSGIAFTERGTHELKGVPDTWQLYAATT
jgi:class 3 adenylate cyclase